MMSVDDEDLRADLDSTYGAKFIGNTIATFNTVIELDGVNIRAGSLIICLGRDIINDGGGGLFRYDSTSTLPVDNGIVFNVAGGGRAVRQIQTTLSENQLSEPVNVRWFGAKGDASEDDTASVLAAYNAAKSRTLFYSVLFPAGRYLTVTSFVFPDFSSGSFIMEGATFIGGGKGADNSQEAVFEIQNVVNGNISGPWTITSKAESGPVMSNPNAYKSGFFVRAKPGGTLQPTLGIAAFFSVSDLTTIRIGNGIRVGEINNDAQTSEMQFVNCKTPFTVNPVQIAGSQTIANFVGCTLASNKVDGITNAINATLINDGGACGIIGGSFEQHSNSETQAVLMGPCRSNQYSNPYGQVTISGACIEVIAPLLQVTNRYGYANPSSFMSRFTVTGCTGGYLGSVPLDANIISVFDVTYEGNVSIPNGSSFYAQTTSSQRTGYNVNAGGNSKVKINVGKTVFDTVTGFKGYPAGILGGILIHPLMLATSANVATQNVPATTNTVIVWGNNPPDPLRTGRYQYILDPVTGVIVVPDAGVRIMQIEASILLDTPATTGRLTLNRNGVIYVYGIISAGVAHLNTSIPDPIVGENITVELNISAKSSLTSASKVNIYIET